jgi:hypothetical protein
MQTPRPDPAIPSSSRDGHASHSGIVANTWYDPLLKKSINVVDDPVQQPVGGQGREHRRRISLVSLWVTF